MDLSKKENKNVSTYFSLRVYKNILTETNNLKIQDMFKFQNNMKFKIYSWLSRNIELEDSYHTTAKNLFVTTAKHTNFAVKEAEWINSSNQELQKLYIKDLENKMEMKENKLAKTEKSLAFWINFKNHIVLISKLTKTGATINDKSFGFYKIITYNNDKYVEAHYKEKTEIYNLYDFEHKLIDKKIKTLKNRINMIKRSMVQNNIKLEKLKIKPFRSIFGSKKLFKSQYTKKEYIKNHKLWRDDFHKKRYSSMQLQGVNEADQGNYSVRYDYDKNILKLNLPDNTWIDIKGVDFKYKKIDIKSRIINALNNKSKTEKKAKTPPVSWRIEDKGDYYIFKITINNIKEEDSHVNHSTSDGVIGYDINYNHIAWSETDSIGNLLSHGVLPFNIEDKASGQSNKILEAIAIKLTDIAILKNKPLVGEDLKNTQKSITLYGSTKRNKRISQFAHNKIISSIESRAYKKNVCVLKINPAYTSFQGKLKYMRIKGLSIHESASYCIARRGLFQNKVKPKELYYEKIPKEYQKFKKNWKALYSELRNINTDFMYKRYDFSKCINLKAVKNKILIDNKVISF